MKCKECPEPEIYPENQPIINAYSAVYTQWRTNAMGQLYGLDYVAVESALNMLNIEVTPEIFKGIQVIENRVLEKR